MKFKFNVDLTENTYKDIPSWVIPTLERYIEERTMGGGFITAVLQNDLRGAIARADNDSLKGLRGIVTLLHCHAPDDCWGSKEKVNDWIKGV
jgi:hypothetical protein